MFWSTKSNRRFVAVRVTAVAVVRVGGPNVPAAQESQRNLIFAAWLSPAWFFTRFDLTNNLVETISRSVVLKDFNFYL